MGKKSRDRLSELPDSLIQEILSWLTLRDAVKTSLLSKSWRELWTTIPCLNFEESVETLDFVDEALRRWKGCCINRFEISIKKSGGTRKCAPLLRYSTVENEIVGKIEGRKSINFYWALLQIRGWDKLKSLTLRGFGLGGFCFPLFPHLEILNLGLTRGNQRRSMTIICSHSLKRLSIHTYVPESSDYTAAELIIHSPKLEALSLVGDAYNMYTLVVSNLAELTLRFDEARDVVLENTLMQILPRIRHVQALALSLRCSKMIGVMQHNYKFKPLSNVKILEFIGGYELEPKEKAGLFDICPKVEKLLIDGKPSKVVNNQYSQKNFEIGESSQATLLIELQESDDLMAKQEKAMEESEQEEEIQENEQEEEIQENEQEEEMEERIVQQKGKKMKRKQRKRKRKQRSKNVWQSCTLVVVMLIVLWFLSRA